MLIKEPLFKAVNCHQKLEAMHYLLVNIFGSIWILSSSLKKVVQKSISLFGLRKKYKQWLIAVSASIITWPCSANRIPYPFLERKTKVESISTLDFQKYSKFKDFLSILKTTETSKFNMPSTLIDCNIYTKFSVHTTNSFEGNRGTIFISVRKQKLIIF